MIVVSDVETNQAKQWIAALGGEANVNSVEPIAETRVRVEVADDSKVDIEALKRAGLTACVKVGDGAWHLVAGLEAAQYAEGMRRRVAAAAK
ncbi:MAG: PTS transporter subunit EIIB [Propionibacteriaceae bacterium]|nr:PTS transporter subunit EIIB [Propionibacteriaceae bacterium]